MQLLSLWWEDSGKLSALGALGNGTQHFSISPFLFIPGLGFLDYYFWGIFLKGLSFVTWSETGFCLKSDFGRAHQFQHKHRTFHSLKGTILCRVCTQKAHHFKLLSISVGRYQVSQSLVKAFSVRIHCQKS